VARTEATNPATTIDGVAYRTWQEPGVSWVEYEIQEPWTVTLGFSDRDGVLELAEVHVIPTRDEPAERSANPRERKRGWGQRGPDPERVPPGGLTMRGLRRMVNVEGALRAALRNVPLPDSYLSGAGFVSADRPSTQPVPGRRDPVLLPLVAVLYDEAIRSGKPTQDYLWKELTRRGVKCALGTVPNLVGAARRAGYLPATKQGLKSGSATDEARRLVSARAKAQ
jgi:hypothetical protein